MPFGLTDAQWWRFVQMAPSEQRRLVANLSPEDALTFDADFEAWADRNQLPPQNEGWRVWLMMAGRGFGKTRAGAEWVHRLAMAGGRRIALVAASIDEARSVMVEGVSGLLGVARRNRVRVTWEPSLGRLKWGAKLQLIAVDWESPDGEVLSLMSGELGQIARKDGAFEADLLGVASRLERPICPFTSPDCRAELGDPKCRVDMAGRRLRALVTSAAGHNVEIDQPVDERFRFGTIRFLAGAANGERRTILAADGHQLSLRSAPAGGVAVGTAVEIVEGCDKTLATCSGRFANAINFRGEPNLPGNDLLTRYPGA
jgi:uncharacterized phage protein (TIGR02218 family)